jgi:membrane protein
MPRPFLNWTLRGAVVATVYALVRRGGGKAVLSENESAKPAVALKAREPLIVPTSFWGRVKLLLSTTAKEWSQDHVLRLSSSLSYYAIFSLAPLLVLVLTVCGALFGEEAVRGQLDDQLRSVMGPQAAQTVQQMIRGATNAGASTLATILGLLALVFGATGFFGEVKSALNTIWDAETPASARPVWEWVRTRFLSFGMIVVMMTLLMTSLVFSTVLAFAASYLAQHFAVHPVVWGVLGFLTGVAMETVLFALLFRVLPDVRFPVRDVWWGAAITALLFEAGKWALGWYLGREASASAYGAAGSLLIVLTWIYYTSIIVLTGAEFTQVHSRLRGKGVRL